MIIRIISTLVALPFLFFFVIAGGFYLQLATTVIALVGMYELYKAVSGKIKPVHFLGFVIMLVYGLVPHRLLYNYFYIIAIICVLIILVMLVFFYKSININDGAITVFGFLYVGMLIYNIYLIREMPMGNVYVWLPFICAFGSDTGAYFVGVSIGKHRLAPVLSPKKSIEGSIGGIITGCLLCGIYCFVADKLGYVNYNDNEIIMLAVFGGIASAFSQLGDLAASSIKRYTGIKDYGKLMPGHGGVLDRFDSVLFTAPIIFLIVEYLI